jgi:hypothetical protein
MWPWFHKAPHDAGIWGRMHDEARIKSLSASPLLTGDCMAGLGSPSTLATVRPATYWAKSTRLET